MAEKDHDKPGHKVAHFLWSLILKNKKWNRPIFLYIIVVLQTIKKKGCPMYIITYTSELENQKDYQVQVEAPLEMAGLF